MVQEEVNESEWNNPDNWSGGLYFSKKDTRIWVPKQIRSLGWTINIGQKKGASCMMRLFLGIIVMAVLITIVIANLILNK